MNDAGDCSTMMVSCLGAVSLIPSVPHLLFDLFPSLFYFLN